jgi:hypothetical protein
MAGSVLAIHDFLFWKFRKDVDARHIQREDGFALDVPGMTFYASTNTTHFMRWNAPSLTSIRNADRSS